MNVTQDELEDVVFRGRSEVNNFVGDYTRRLKRATQAAIKLDLEVNGLDGRTAGEVASAAFANAQRSVLELDAPATPALAE